MYCMFDELILWKSGNFEFVESNQVCIVWRRSKIILNVPWYLEFQGVFIKINKDCTRSGYRFLFPFLFQFEMIFFKTICFWEIIEVSIIIKEKENWDSPKNTYNWVESYLKKVKYSKHWKHHRELNRQAFSIIYKIDTNYVCRAFHPSTKIKNIN